MAPPNTPEIALIEQLASPPNISLQILGTHMNGPTEVVDYDLWVDCSKDAKIKSGEFVTSNKNELRSWDQSESSASFSTTSSGWLRDWLRDSNRRSRTIRMTRKLLCLRLGKSNNRSWTVQKLIDLPDTDFDTIRGYINGIAGSALYGRSIEIKIHTPADGDALPEKHTAIVRAKWSPRPPWTPPEITRDLSLSSPPTESSDGFGSPGTVAEKTWDQVIRWAMIYRTRGFISFDDPLPCVGQSPRRRASTVNRTCTVISWNGTEWERADLKCFSKWGSDVYICD